VKVVEDLAVSHNVLLKVVGDLVDPDNTSKLMSVADTTRSPIAAKYTVGVDYLKNFELH
jgi:hypothetical protein